MPANLRNLVCWALHSDVNQRPKSFQDIVDSLITPELTAWAEVLRCKQKTLEPQDSHHMRILSHALEMLLALQEDCFGRNHHVVGCTLSCLGSVSCCHLGEAWRGRDLLEKALCIQERVYGPEHRVVATILTNLGNAYGDLGDP